MSTRPSPTGLTSPFTVLFQVHNEQIVLGVRLWAQDANQAERLALKKCEQLGPPEGEYAHGGSIGSRGPTFGSRYESLIISGHPEITADLLCGEPTWVTGGPWASREAPDSASLVGRCDRCGKIEPTSTLVGRSCNHDLCADCVEALTEGTFLRGAE
jgi:hypothetical protein